jgi:ABC 3 transport family/HEAT repeats
VPQEAIIGITYAVALAAIILGSARLPHGAEEVRDLQAGSILWVSGQTVALTAALYALIGAFHFVFRKRFLAISRDPERAEAEGIRVRLWDFLFYVSFGFVVTSSVSIAGVLLVFSYLVIPSVVAVLFADGVAARLAIGWCVGTLISAAGVTISYLEDLPSGPVIVVCFGAFLALAGVVHYVLHAPRRLAATVRVVGIAAGVALLLQGTLLLRKRADADLAHVLETGTKSERLIVLHRVAEDPDLWHAVQGVVPHLLSEGGSDIEVQLALLELIEHLGRGELAPQVEPLLRSSYDAVREEAVKALRTLGSPKSVEPILAAAQAEEDEYIRVEMAEALLEFGDARGIPILLDVMERADARQARRDAFEHLEAHLHTTLPYDPEAPEAGRAKQIAAFRQWWDEHRDGLRPDPAGDGR